MSTTERDASTVDVERTDSEKKSIWYRLYHGETAIDFMGQRRRWFLVSGIIILVGLISLFTRGLNFGIDFKGGTAWEVKTEASVGQVRSALGQFNLKDPKIEVLTARGSGGRSIRVQADVKGQSAEALKKKGDVRDALAKVAGTDREHVDFTDVGASWGK